MCIHICHIICVTVDQVEFVSLCMAVYMTYNGGHSCGMFLLQMDDFSGLEYNPVPATHNGDFSCLCFNPL